MVICKKKPQKTKKQNKTTHTKTTHNKKWTRNCDLYMKCICMWLVLYNVLLTGFYTGLVTSPSCFPVQNIFASKMNGFFHAEYVFNVDRSCWNLKDWTKVFHYHKSDDFLVNFCSVVSCFFGMVSFFITISYDDNYVHFSVDLYYSYFIL